MGKHVLLHRERGNHRILDARLTQRNDTGLGFYLKGTQEQNLTVKKATFRYILLTADENRHVSMRTVTRFTDLVEKGGLCKSTSYVMKLPRNQTDLATENTQEGDVAFKETALSMYPAIPHSFACERRPI